MKVKKSRFRLFLTFINPSAGYGDICYNDI